MPFQSPKQRRYLHANHPEIAKRWERDYAGGGRIGFADGPKIPKKFLEDLKRKNFHKMLEEYRRWKEDYDRRKDLGVTQEAAHGGLIPSHEAGIYGLAEGGNIRLQPHTASDLLVQKTSSGERPKYQPPGHVDAAPSKSTSAGEGGHHGNVAHGPGGRFETANTRTTTTTPTTDDKGDGVYQDRIIKLADLKRKSDLKDIIERGDEEKYDNPLDKYSHTPQGVINRRTFLEKQALDNWNAVKDSNKTWAKKKAGKVLVDQLLLGGATFGLSDVIGGIVQGFKTNKAKNEFINTIKDSIAEYEKLGFAKHHHSQDTLIQDLNQQLLDLTQTKKQPDVPTGGDGVTGIASITYDDIEDTNKKELASSRWRQEQEKVDRSKQMAYWRMMMEPYMSAQGGRVPAGYNTGGLSNLFRLKNV